MSDFETHINKLRSLIKTSEDSQDKSEALMLLAILEMKTLTFTSPKPIRPNSTVNSTCPKCGCPLTITYP